MNKAPLLALIAIFIYPSLSAQKIAGNWNGNIEVNGAEIPIVFHFNKTSDGKIDGKWDSPKQSAIGLPFSSIDANADSVHLGVKMIDTAGQPVAFKFFKN